MKDVAKGSVGSQGIYREPQPESSVGGFYADPRGGREVLNFNVGWRFLKGSGEGAESAGFDDGHWALVNLPHGLETLPLEASGGVNYQGEAWYRKRFRISEAMSGKRITLHFEGAMGKSRFLLNGERVGEHFGGFLPIVLDVTDIVDLTAENVIVVCVDNSDDPAYPPGKPQAALDFCYFGGIYRDVWMVATNKIHITDPNETDVIAGGGVFVHYKDVSRERAVVCAKVHVANGASISRTLTIGAVLKNARGAEVGRGTAAAVECPAGSACSATIEFEVHAPHLWHVDDPYLHDLSVVVRDVDGTDLDAVRLRVGIRSIEFRGKDGFWLNGEPFDGKLIGVNRHQDYAYVGNALSNGAHWRDAVLMRQAGVRVVRCAHYPQDPAYMDACDALGIFVIVTTPGWQFWSDDPVFEERVYADIRNMIRRDRNRPCILMWEPILNETNYPGHFAQRVHEIAHEEYPYAGCFTACDRMAAGQEHFDVVYAHIHSCDDVYAKPAQPGEHIDIDYEVEHRCVFTREWGDCPADWRAQSSPSRVQKGWGERAQLIQADHYADPDYVFGSTYESLCAAPAQHVGGTLWHGTDHQRGYHADPFWGGIVDAARQPKFSYQMFRSQVPPICRIPFVESGPFVHIAHLVHPMSEPDVTVFSNCDQVRLTVDGRVVGCQSTTPDGSHMPHHPVVFEKAFRFYRHGHKPQTLVAEGIINGAAVATCTRQAWDRRERLQLEVGLQNIPLRADGGDFVPVVARIVDKRGEVVRLTEDTIRFSVEGPAAIVGDGLYTINPQPLCWGEAVVLVRAGIEPGIITVRAESAQAGVCKPLAAEIRFESMPTHGLAFLEAPEVRRQEAAVSAESLSLQQLKETVARLSAEVTDLKAAHVELQQEKFM